MICRVEGVNTAVLTKCREQISLSLLEVAKKANITNYEACEKGDEKLTYKQLDKLGELYEVPNWVFVSESLPEQYDFDKSITAFRKFKETSQSSFGNFRVRKLVAIIERRRHLIVDLREILQDPVKDFDPPNLGVNAAPEVAAQKVREWLGTTDNHSFDEWRDKLESKSIFTFVTSKYPGKSCIDLKEFRGFAIYHDTLPIIVVNSKDAHKAKSFTLFNELGHLIQNEDGIDEWHQNHDGEKWCDKFAGCILMPESALEKEASRYQRYDLDSATRIAAAFNVSPYACLVRLAQLQYINRNEYFELKNILEAEYKRVLKERKGQKSTIARKLGQEALDKFGRLYAQTLFNAWSEGEMQLTKIRNAFELNDVEHVFEMQKRL